MQGDILFFGADPIGILSLSALSPVKGKMDFDQPCTDTIGWGRAVKILVILALFSRCPGHKRLKKSLSALDLLNEWMDLKQTCKDVSSRDGKEVVRFFSDLGLIFNARGQRMLKNGLSAPYLLNGWMNLSQTCTKRTDYFTDHDPFFKVIGGQKMLKTTLAAPYLRNGWTDFN